MNAIEAMAGIVDRPKILLAAQRRFSPRKWKRCSIPYQGIIDPILATVLVCTRLL